MDSRRTPPTIIDERLVSQAKIEELDRFKKLEVCKVVRRPDLEHDEDFVWIGTKWVVTNKGSDSSTVIKRGLIGQGLVDGTMRGGLFAGTPGLQAARCSTHQFGHCVVGARRECRWRYWTSRALCCIVKRAGNCNGISSGRIPAASMEHGVASWTKPCVALATLP